MINREIKFRVWAGTQMEYNVVVGELGAFYAKIDSNDSACLNPTSKYYPETPVMQFTGLLDKKNKEIYEGDILKVSASEAEETDIPNVAEVRYGKGIFDGGYYDYIGFYLVSKNGKVMEPREITDLVNQGRSVNFTFEVCGNIFENPDLLK